MLSPGVIRIKDLLVRTNNPQDACYFPPYPADTATLDEIEELMAKRASALLIIDRPVQR